MSLVFLVSPEDAAAIGEEALRQISHSLPVSGEIDLALVDQATIQQINREQRGIDEPTDVLSFPLYSSLSAVPTSAMTPLLGSIIISAAQAELYHETLPQLVAHGVLHIFGYDHEIDLEEWLLYENNLLQELRNNGLIVRGIEQW